MKRVLTKFLAISGIALLMLASCKKDENKVVSNGGKPGALTANATTLVLDKTKLTDTTKVINFSFNKADYGYTGSAITNTLQIDAANDNWANPTTFSMGTKTFAQGFSTAAFNALVLKLSLPAGVASQINVRIAHSVSPNVSPVYSNVLSLTVTPFNLTSWVYVPGAYEGWGNPGPQEDSLVSVTGNGVYVGIINFTAGNRDFLIVPIKGKWDNKWATVDNAATGATEASYTTEYVTGGGNNFFAPTTAGQYLVTFDSNAGTLTMKQVNYYSLTGPATPAGDWGLDSDLKYINDGNDTWTGIFPFTVNQFKVRQSHAWDKSWGIPQAGSEGDGVAGTLNDTKNDNLAITTAGNYKVTFTIPVTLLNAVPAVTATYTLVKQ